MIATTTISSMSVKPDCVFIAILLGASSLSKGTERHAPYSLVNDSWLINSHFSFRRPVEAWGQVVVLPRGGGIRISTRGHLDFLC